MTPDDPRHGTQRGFFAGCRENCCRRARARYEKQGRVARLAGGRAVPAIGAQRRIQALMTLGWSGRDIADAAGWKSNNYVLRVLKGQKGNPCSWVERKTHDRIVTVYEQLSMQLPEQTPIHKRTQAMATRNGWVPPLAWDDESLDNPNARPQTYTPAENRDRNDIDPVVIDRFLARQITPGLWATIAEKREIIARWDGSRGELARLTGWNVHRYIDREDGAA